MRYSLTHMSRRTMAVTVLLLGVTALAAAAARVTLSVPARTDIELRTPAPPKVADRAQPATEAQGAPLFAALGARSRALPDETIGGEAIAASAVPKGRRENAPFETRAAEAGQFRDFAGERSRRPSSGGGSGGSGAFGGGGIGGGGGTGGGAGKARARDGEAASPDAGQTTSAAASGGGSGSSSSTNTGGPSVGAAASTTGTGVASAAKGNVPGSATGLVIATETAPVPGNGPSPSGTPEPLTLLLVGSGLVGLYGARKHITG